MNISSRVLFSIVLGALVCAVLLVGIFYQYSEQVHQTTHQTQVLEPARQAIEHLLVTIYDDFLLVEEYLLIEEYSTLLTYDIQLEHTSEQCEILTEEVEELIILEELTNEDAIQAYERAVLIFTSWERSRNTLLSMHKESVATQTNNDEDMKEQRQRFIALMQESTQEFTTSLELLNQQQLQEHMQLQERTTTIKTMLLIFLVLFVIVVAGSSYLLFIRLTRPLDEMIEVSQQFVQGNYAARNTRRSKVSELSSLADQLNSVYALIEKKFHTPAQKKEVSVQLLPAQCKEIVEYITYMAEQGKKPTMKDIKKKFNLTHPTALARIRYLQEHDFIELEKEGRNKYISLK